MSREARDSNPREWFSLEHYIDGTEQAMDNATSVVAEADADLEKALDELGLLSLEQEAWAVGNLQHAIALLVRARVRLVEVTDHAKETRFCAAGARSHLEGGDIAEKGRAS